MSGPEKVEVTKSRFLEKSEFIVLGRQAHHSRVQFMLYDSSTDGLLQSNEVSNMLAALPEGTAVYQE